MSPSNRTRTLSFVAFASLAALSGCGREPSAEQTFADRIEAAPLAPIDALAHTAPAAATVPVSRVLRAPAAELSGAALTPVVAREGRLDVLDAPSSIAPTGSSIAYQGADTLSADSPARIALAQRSPEINVALTLNSPARRVAVCAPILHAEALSLEAAPTLVLGTDTCETDDDCVPDGCHATSCVAAAEMAPGALPGELECTADLQYGTTDGGGCLCHVGHCAARLSTPPQGI